MSNPGHSRFSPSGFSRWSNCPGSLNLIDAHPEIVPVSSKYADEGTAAHAAAEAWLTKGKEPKAEFKEHLQVYFDHCDGLRRGKNPFWVEHRSGIPDTECWGTSDFVCFDRRTKTLHVVDLKYGAGVAVEVEDNSQLKIYALIVLMSMPEIRAETVRITIVQPRCYHEDGPIRSHDVDTIDLIGFEHEVLTAIEATKNPKAPLKAGSHCRWCSVASVCPEVKNKVQEVARERFTDLPIDKLDREKLSETLHALPMMESFIKNVRELAYQEAMRGRSIPGWKLVEKRSHRKWDETRDVPKILEDEFGLSPLEFYEKKLRSPAQVEKFLYGEDKVALKTLIKTESTGCTLVPESDRRAAVIPSDAKTVFTELTDETSKEE